MPPEIARFVRDAYASRCAATNTALALNEAAWELIGMRFARSIATVFALCAVLMNVGALARHHVMAVDSGAALVASAFCGADDGDRQNHVQGAAQCIVCGADLAACTADASALGAPYFFIDRAVPVAVPDFDLRRVSIGAFARGPPLG